jgi:hypothetical protein
MAALLLMQQATATEPRVIKDTGRRKLPGYVSRRTEVLKQTPFDGFESAIGFRIPGRCPTCRTQSDCLQVRMTEYDIFMNDPTQ